MNVYVFIPEYFSFVAIFIPEYYYYYLPEPGDGVVVEHGSVGDPALVHRVQVHAELAGDLVQNSSKIKAKNNIVKHQVTVLC